MQHSITLLCADEFFCILEFLSFVDILRFTHVCKLFRNVVCSLPSLWKRINFSQLEARRKIKDQHVKAFLSAIDCSCVERIDLDRCGVTSKCLVTIAKNCPKLTELSLRFCENVEVNKLNRTLKSVLKYLNNLHCLYIEGISGSSTDIKNVVKLQEIMLDTEIDVQVCDCEKSLVVADENSCDGCGRICCDTGNCLLLQCCDICCECFCEQCKQVIICECCKNSYCDDCMVMDYCDKCNCWYCTDCTQFVVCHFCGDTLCEFCLIMH